MRWVAWQRRYRFATIRMPMNEAMERVRQDKLREVRAGHDGTWVAHPGLVPIAKAVFDEYMKRPNQIHRPANAKSPNQ